MDMFNEVFFEVMMEGEMQLGEYFLSQYQQLILLKILIGKILKFKGLWEITAKYGIPYFSNFVNSDMKPEDTRSMCCRVRLDWMN